MVLENSSQTWELWMVSYDQWDSICVLVLTHYECLRPINTGGSIYLLLYLLLLISSVDQIFFKFHCPS